MDAVIELEKSRGSVNDDRCRIWGKQFVVGQNGEDTRARWAQELDASEGLADDAW